MSAPPANPKQVVGIIPWLPWPLSAWSWWTEPVRAERLAMLRIGLGLALLWDVAYNYAPHVFAFYGRGGPGDPAHFTWYFDAPRTRWSLLRGVGHEAGFNLALGVWILTALWMVGNSLARILLHRKFPPANDRTGIALGLWLFAYTWYVAGVWAHLIEARVVSPIEAGEVAPLAWVVPLCGFSLACFFFTLEFVQRLLDSSHRIGWASALFCLFVTGAVLFPIGTQLEEIDPSSEWVRLLKPWQEDEGMLLAAMALWLYAAFLLLIGRWTRLAAIAAWMLSLSFYNANHYLDNAGDTLRMILLFYLMLCPCGAVWSVDALFARQPRPIHVHPWPLRLIFVQMIFIYFMNGLYKLFGQDWLDLVALYYVLGDVAIARFSLSWLPIPFVLTQIMTWSVLVWEATFPLLVLYKWTRILALIMGVMFHLGIFATMELGPFVPYALCMYLPLLPWERLSRRPTEEAELVVEIVEAQGPANKELPDSPDAPCGLALENEQAGAKPRGD